MIHATFKFPKVLHPNDETGKIWSPIKEADLHVVPRNGDRVIFDEDTPLTLVTPGVKTKVERYGDVWGTRVMQVTYVTHKISPRHAHSVTIYVE